MMKKGSSFFLTMAGLEPAIQDNNVPKLFLGGLDSPMEMFNRSRIRSSIGFGLTQPPSKKTP
jgi:hypothetical protein